MSPQERYKKLKEYLSAENPVLLDIIDDYIALDGIARKIGLLEKSETYTSYISWWPMISVLGTFSAGKSTFINEYLKEDVQKSGSQAVDDKFTVICYGGEENKVTTLPGIALDADPRFPFYNISEEINKVDSGEGDRVNQYLQLKTLKSDRIKGKILIDSPGYDADSQRDGVLRITEHIVDISDLVLIFFDARHPEPGAMRDTLKHLVSMTIKHKDANKILYILNQIDATVKEDNLEEVIASWQRALSNEGLITGDFYHIYNEQAAENAGIEVLERLKQKKDIDMHRIVDRIDKVRIERAYRIVKSVENFAKTIMEEQLPKLHKTLISWRKNTLIADGVIIVLLGALFVLLWEQFDLIHTQYALISYGVFSFVVLLFAHGNFKRFFAKKAVEIWEEKEPAIAQAIRRNTGWLRSLFGFGASWHKQSKEELNKLISKSKEIIQKLNDQFVSTATFKEVGKKESDSPLEQYTGE